MAIPALPWQISASFGCCVNLRLNGVFQFDALEIFFNAAHNLLTTNAISARYAERRKRVFLQ
jgi:hypothetical protein